MQYCTVSDLRENIAGLTADNNKAPSSFLQSLIDRKSSLIDARISKRYKLPITLSSNPKSYAVLNDILIDLCRESVSMILAVSTTSPDGNQFPVGYNLTKRARESISFVETGSLPLPDATLCDSCGSFNSGQYDDTEVLGIPYSTKTEESFKTNYA